ncbi:hypothetical protein G7054_g15107 [Neopestalotiopsis clavispora]|nr:hypothetical protein G7054_g15107 [Neopestalotiopsis clavispora]
MDDVEKPRSAPPSASCLDDKNDTFEAMLSDFQREFQIKQDSMELVTSKVGEICEAALGAAGVRHTTISSRIKSWKSAEGSIRRKRHERAMRRQLRATVESRKQDWDTYCSHSNLEPRETGPFGSAKEMLNHLRDFGGVRISLYFPGDVEYISDIFKKRFKVDSETRKQQSKDVTMDLQRRLEKLKSDNPIEKISEQYTERSFPGYKATHFHVRLLDEDIPPKKMAVWKDFVVEIQVGTLVMHAWSEIEHDLIYKPLEDSQTISEDEVRLLDLINGIVATGEAALRQLETSTKRRHNQRAGDKEASAMSYYELGHWLEKYWVEVHKVKIDGDWEYLTQLYAITKGTGHHQLGKIQQILGKIEVNEVKHYRRLPIQMLEVICKPIDNFQEPRFPGTQSEKVLNNARFWATQFVHSINMATFFGVAGTFFNVPNLPKRPRIATILDIIHPTSPSYETMDTVVAIANYCETILQYHEKKREGDNQLLRIATWLPRMDCVITSSEHDGIIIPKQWVRAFMDEEKKVIAAKSQIQ